MTAGTHISLDIEVLEVEGMLPDVNADDRNMSEKRILVGSSGDLETLGAWVQTLQSMLIVNIRSGGLCRLTSQPQPLPWMPKVAVLNSFLRLSRLPNAATIASLSGPSLSAPPLPFFSDDAGARFFQNNEWLMWPVRNPINIGRQGQMMRLAISD